MSMGGWERSHAAHTSVRAHTHITHAPTHSEMSGILPSASLTVSIASMASMVAEGWSKEEKERRTGRERRWQSPRERWSTKKGGGEGKRSEGWNMLCADMRKHLCRMSEQRLLRRLRQAELNVVKQSLVGKQCRQNFGWSKNQTGSHKNIKRDLTLAWEIRQVLCDLWRAPWTKAEVQDCSFWRPAWTNICLAEHVKFSPCYSVGQIHHKYTQVRDSLSSISCVTSIWFQY